MAADVRYLDVDALWLTIYLPLEQNSFSDSPELGWFAPTNLIVRSALSPETLASPIRDAIHRINADIPVDRVEAIEFFFSRELARHRFHAVMLGLFAATALGLAVVGVYAVTSVSVSARRSEIGLRVALGATPFHAVQTVFGSSVAVSLAGTGLGLLVALGTSRLLEGFLFEVSPLDGASFLGAATTLLSSSLLASFVPASRAALVDPAVTLRHE